MIQKIIKTAIQIRFSDIDSMGHVGNNIYQIYFDSGRIHWVQVVLGNDFFGHDKTMFVVRTEIDYIKQTTLLDKVEVLTKLTRIGAKSICMEQTLHNINSGDIHARCISVLSGFDKQSQTSLILPDTWRNKLQTFLA